MHSQPKASKDHARSGLPLVGGYFIVNPLRRLLHNPGEDRRPLREDGDGQWESDIVCWLRRTSRRKGEKDE